MSTPITFNSISYSVPAYGDTGWAQGSGNLSSYLIALATGTLQQSGGTFSLTADTNFGANFGLASIYYKSISANIASTGVLRLANTDTIDFRNAANSADLALGVNTSNQLTFGGTTIPVLGNYIPATPTQTISVNTSWSAQTYIPSGNIITVNTGITLFISGDLQAGPYQIFAGAGTVVFNNGYFGNVYPEWFGALCNGTNDDALAIQKAVTAMPLGGILKLGAKTYTLKTGITVTFPSLTIQGTVGPSPTDGPYSAGGTQLVGTNGVNAFTIGSEYFTMQDVNLSLPLGATSACVGIAITSSFYVKIDHCRVTNYSTSIRLTSSTDSYINQCYLSSTGVTVSAAVGLEINGASHLQNPSVYIRDCISAAGTFSGTYYGYWLHGNRINDVRFTNCESDGATYGFYLDGTSVLDAGYSGDITLNGCASDASVTYGFYVNTCNATSTINIVNGWASSATIGIYVATSFGVNVSNMQCYGNATAGVYIGASSKDCSVIGNTIRLAGSNGIVVDGSPSCTVANNLIVGGGSTTYAIQLVSGATLGTYTGNVADGPSAAFTTGIGSATSCDNCVFTGNVMPATICTTPYALNLGSNTHDILIAANTAANMGGQKISGIANGSASTDAAAFGQLTFGTVTSVSGTTNQIASTGGATPVLSLASPMTTPGAVTVTGNLAFAATASQGVKGSTTNDSGAAGNMGEFISAVVASGSPVALTSGTAVNITSMSLTAGDWDVFGIVGYIPAGTLTVAFQSTGTTSATMNNDQTETYLPISTTVACRAAVGTWRYSLASTTTVYLIASPTFTSTCGGFGSIGARRVR